MSEAIRVLQELRALSWREELQATSTLLSAQDRAEEARLIAEACFKQASAYTAQLREAMEYAPEEWFNNAPPCHICGLPRREDSPASPVHCDERGECCQVPF